MRNTFVEDKMTEFIDASLDFFESAEGVEWMRKTLVETITTAKRETLREVKTKAESIKVKTHRHKIDCKNYDECQKFTAFEMAHNRGLDALITHLESELLV